MKHVFTLSILILIVISFANDSMAKMYMWKDKNGISHFSESPPELEQDVRTIETFNYPPPEPKLNQANSQIVYNLNPEDDYSKKTNNSVKIYTTSWCPYCKKAIAFLRDNGIQFRQYDIEKDKEAAAEMKASGGTGGVPFAIINENKVPGFSERTYKNILGLK